MKKYAVSVIVPVYNVEKYIKECLESLVNQTLKNIEIIVVNDGSPDNSQSIIDEYTKKYPDKIKSYVKKNGGLSDARNYGIERANGEYIAFVDSDDFVDKNMCLIMYKRAKAYNCDIVVAPYFRYKIGSFKKTIGCKMNVNEKIFHGREFMKLNEVMIVCNKIYKLEFIKQFKFKKDTWYEDVAWTPIVMSYAKRVSYVNKPFYHYIIRENSITQSKTDIRTIQGIDSVFYSINNCNPNERQVIEYFGFKRLLFETRMRAPYREKYMDAIKKLLSNLKENIYLKQNQYYYEKYIELNNNLYIIPRKFYYANFENSKKYNDDLKNVWENFLSCEIGNFKCLSNKNIITEDERLKRAYNEKKYKLVNDYVLLHEIYENGGVALNYNVKFEKFISECLINKCFFCYDENGNITTDIWGAIPKSGVIKEILNIFDKHLNKGYLEDDLLDKCFVEYLKENKKYILDNSTKKYDFGLTIYTHNYFYNTNKLKNKNAKIKKMIKTLYRKVTKITFVRYFFAYILICYRLLKKSKNLKYLIYSNYYNKKEINENMFLFESFYGRGLLSNPYALFLDLTKRNDFNSKKIIWVLDKKKNHKSTIKEIKSNFNNVLFVERGSLKYYKYLATSKFLINDVSFSFEFIKKEEQIYINTWHSITVKTLGYDIPGNPLSAKNVVRNFFMCDYFLSPNDFMGKEIFSKSHMMNNIYSGKIIQEGFPRDDLTFIYKRKQVIDMMKSCGVDIDDNKKIIVYAPTWRGDSLSNPSDDIESYKKLLEKVENNIDKNKYQILLRVHQLVYKNLDKKNDLITKIVPSTIDANIMFAATDLLITDYSSIFFDYLPTKKPLLFYCPDIEEYNKYRGNYFTKEDLPSHTSTNIEELCYDINHLNEIIKQYESKYTDFLHKYCPFEDGKDSKRINDGIFYKKNIRTFQIAHPKTKILLYVKNIRQIDNYVERLIKSLNKNNYDITLFVKDNHNQIYYDELQEYVKNGVRVFGMSHSKYYSYTIKEFFYVNFIKYKEKLSDNERNIVNKYFKKEWLRNFGNCSFDIIIDLSGSDLYFSYLFLNGNNNAIKIINNIYSKNESKNHKIKHIKEVYKEYDASFTNFTSLINLLKGFEENE